MVRNIGLGPASNVVMIDNVPAFLSITGVTVVPAWPCSIGVNTITMTWPTLPVGASCTVASDTEVNSLGVPPGGTNDVRVRGTPDADPDNNTASATVTIVTDQGAPETGFAPRRSVDLPAQPISAAYLDYDDLCLVVASLDVDAVIFGVPLTENGWDVTWLWDNADYLNATAFPTWSGNSVITGHVWLPNGLPGPFIGLRDLQYGDVVVVHGRGLRYILRGAGSGYGRAG